MRQTTKPTRRRPGRPRKPADEKYEIWAIRFPPEELEAFRQAVPMGERSEFARAAIRRAVARVLRREQVA